MNRFRRVLASATVSLVSLLAAPAPSLSSQLNLQSGGAGASCKVAMESVKSVAQGKSGAVSVFAPPECFPLRLRLSVPAGMGDAAFADGSRETRLETPGVVEIDGRMATTLPGGMVLKALNDATLEELSSLPFDVEPPVQAPRIFYLGKDVTDTLQTVVVGQQISLSVCLHPGVDARSERWSIDPRGRSVGGFLHTTLLGGALPVVAKGEQVTFHWVGPGNNLEVKYILTLANGEEVTSRVRFDVEGPSYANIGVTQGKPTIAQGPLPNSYYMVYGGPGMTFVASYLLPEELTHNYTWVQVIRSDRMMINTDAGKMVCVPRGQPVADAGAGLDSGYPYDAKNPTTDSPPMQLTADTHETRRWLAARMYILWGSGLSNSVPVPLGYVDWHFEAQAIQKDRSRNLWELGSTNGGPDHPERPFTASRSYPAWSGLVPYTGILNCD